MEFRTYVPGDPIEGTELIDDGWHDVVCVKADDGFDADGTGRLKLTFRPVREADRFAWPVLRITDSARGLRLAAAVSDALGIDRSQGLSLYPEDVEGKRLSIRTRKWSGDDNRESVGIDSVRAVGIVSGFAGGVAPGGRRPAADASAVVRPGRWEEPSTQAAAVEDPTADPDFPSPPPAAAPALRPAETQPPRRGGGRAPRSEAGGPPAARGGDDIPF